MDSRIGHLHYRVVTAPGVRVPPGLERLARERVGEALGAALDAALGEDSSVYVLRSVRADLTLDMDARPPDTLIARQWADRLAAAITHAIAEDGDDAVARFADEAEFIARFAADLAGGVAWEHWFYGAFAELRPLGHRAALRRVLLENRRQLPAILAWLARQGTLERVLAGLDPRTLAALERRIPEPELVRPLVAAALRLAEALGRSRGDAPDPEELLDAYVAEARVAPTWRERRTLSESVLDVLRFLVRGGHLALPEPGRAEELRRSLEPLLAELDWLDVDALRAELHELVGAGERGAPRAAAAVRSGAELALVRELAAAVTPGSVALDLRDPASAANALRIRAAFEARAAGSGTARDPRKAIAAVLAAVQRLTRHPAAAELWPLLVAGDGERAWRRYAEAGGAPEDLELLAEAEPLVRSFAPGSAAASAGGAWILSDCAGALLPARAALDLRLPALAAATAGAPPFRELLLALTLRWGGRPALGQRADAAFAAALGFHDPPGRDDLAAGWAGCTRDGHARLRTDVRSTVEARGLGIAASASERACMEASTLGDREADETLGVLALAVLRGWAGWLRGFGESSVPFVLERFVRRPGAVALSEGRATVELERRPLDLVLEMAGYLGELDAGPALPRRIGFVLVEA